jgi:hypothetical protein
LLYGIAALLSGICCGLQRRLLLWRRRGWEVVGDRSWNELGKFSGWMCGGSVAGVFAIALRMRFFTLLYRGDTPDITHREKSELTAASLRHLAAFGIFYSVMLLCVIFAMNMLLRRVSDHASHR